MIIPNFDLHVIDQSSTSFLDLLIYNNANFRTLQFSDYQKPLNKLHSLQIVSFRKQQEGLYYKRAYALCQKYSTCSSMFKNFFKTHEKFWKCLLLQGYPVGFSRPLFREVKHSNRTKWLSQKRKSHNDITSLITTTCLIVFIP